MNQRERDRLRVLQALEEGHLQQVEAARPLQLSAREVRRLQQQVRAEGDRGLVHRLRGKASNRRMEPALVGRILKEVRERYADFGPTLEAVHV